jgi:protocatechuate 3,4-dioxygenase, alpha subunit
MMAITPSQTVGPFFSIGLIDRRWAAGIDEVVPGPRIRIAGRVLDQDGAPVVDALLEAWQADAAGVYRHPSSRPPRRNDRFTGFARVGTDAEGRYAFATIRPGAVRQPEGGLHAPHINLGVFARGLLRRLHTRIYFPDEPLNDGDPVLVLVPAARRATLIAAPTDAGSYAFDLRLSGDGETVFFEC